MLTQCLCEFHKCTFISVLRKVGVQTALGVVENCKIFKGLCLLRLLMVSHSAHLIAFYIGEELTKISVTKII